MKRKEKRNENFVTEFLKTMKVKGDYEFPISVKSAADLPKLVELVGKTAKVSPNIAALFSLSPSKLAEGLGIKLPAPVLKEINNVKYGKIRSDVQFEKIMQGSQVLSNDSNLEIKSKYKTETKSISDIFKEVKEKKGKVDESLIIDSLIPLEKNIRVVSSGVSKNPLVTTKEKAAKKKSYTGGMDGYDLVVQIKSDFFDEAYRNAYLLAGLLTILGVLPANSQFPLPSIKYSTIAWFLVFCEIELIVDLSNLPKLSVEETGYTAADFSLDFKARIRAKSRSDDPWSDWSQYYRCSAKCRGNIISEVNTAGTSDTYIDLLNGDTEVTPQDQVDDLTLLFITVAAIRYFKSITPRLPLLTALPSRNNFIYTGHWGAFALDPLPNLTLPLLSTLNTFNFAWGSSYETYRHHLLTNNYNMAMGVSEPLFTFLSMRNRPDLPIVQDNVTVTDITFKLKQDYISVTGTGHYTTCCSTESFNWGIRVKLSLDNEGKLKTEVVERSVDLTGWMSTVFQILLPFVGTIVVAIIEAVASDNIPVDQFIVNDAIDIDFSVMSGNIDFKEVKVSQNGVYFLGNVSI
jgi:hypothetical protein